MRGSPASPPEYRRRLRQGHRQETAFGGRQQRQLQGEDRINHGRSIEVEHHKARHQNMVRQQAKGEGEHAGG